GGEHVGRIEQRYTVGVCHAVKADDGPADIFFHDIGHRRRFGVEGPQVGFVPQFVSGLGAAAVVRLDDYRVTDLADEVPGGVQRAHHMVTGHRHACSPVPFFHPALELDPRDKVVLGAGGDV